MNSPEVINFIHSQSNLFWYTPQDKKKDISNEFLVETILNYGDLDAVRELFKVLGFEKTAEIFFKAISIERKRGNYHELTINFFTHVFRRNQQRNP